MDQTLPIYLQISQHIENEIINNHLNPNDKVPSTNEFSKIMKINPATAGKGLNELVDQGILYKRRGMGMYVTSQAKNIILQKRKNRFRNILLPELLMQARQLELSQEELIEMIRSEYNA